MRTGGVDKKEPRKKKRISLLQWLFSPCRCVYVIPFISLRDTNRIEVKKKKKKMGERAGFSAHGKCQLPVAMGHSTPANLLLCLKMRKASILALQWTRYKIWTRNFLRSKLILLVLPQPSQNLTKFRILRSRGMSTRNVPIDEVSFQLQDCTWSSGQ